MNRLTIKTKIKSDYSGTAADYLSLKSGLSKSKVKNAMNKGAFWIKDKKGKLQRVRKASHSLSPGDQIEFYYDEKLLALKPPNAECLHDLKDYSVWFKPAGLMSQGTKFGDHCSLMRQAEVFFNSQRRIFLVHRLDREASGLMLLAHSRDAAARLSRLFRSQEIKKEYLIEVAGNMLESDQYRIELPLDGKNAVTEFKVLSYDSERNSSAVIAMITTGRYHQIRRHFDMIGHPVTGDPRYGTGNKNKEGMKLSAVTLTFQCPYSQKEMHFKVSDVLPQSK